MPYDDPIAEPEEGDLDSLHYEPSSGKLPAKPTGLAGLKGTIKEGAGRPRVLTIQETLKVWNDYVLGADVFDLARELNTSPTEIKAALNLMAAEHGYPDTHLDTEMERFRIVEASDRMKTAITQCIKGSNQIIVDYEAARSKILNGRNFADLLPEEQAKIIALNTARQAELKVVSTFLAEYRQINAAIADVTGVRRSRPTRKQKVVKGIEQVMESMSDDDLKRMAQGNS